MIHACEMSTSPASTTTTAAARGGARMVFVNGALDGIDVPCCVGRRAARGLLATRHLIAIGHRRIGSYRWPARLPSDDGRGGGTRRRIAPGRTLPGRPRRARRFTLEGGRSSARTLLSRLDRPPAVICSSDVIAIGVLQVARELGLRITSDLSWSVSTGSRRPTWVEPELTTSRSRSRRSHRPRSTCCGR